MANAMLSARRIDSVIGRSRARLEPSKSNTIKIVLIETTRAIHIYLPSRRRRSICTAITRQTQANPDKRQNQMGG